ncbi:MAG: nucleotidyltransferase family protein [Ferrovum sp.]|nr:nucleotidyltransferase family protein [Ferrovum sp.]NDU88204.1 nucleotidyltransferase family protein [Ferrovum sp.]
MILAAGRGERLRPLTDTCPKPLQRVGGKPLIEWQIENLKRAGFDELVVNGAWLADQLEDYLGDGSAWGVTLHWSRESVALGTAGGVIQALQWLTDPVFVVVSADIFTDFDYARLKTVRDAWLHSKEEDVSRVRAHVVLVEDPRYPQDFSLDTQGWLRLPQGRAGTYGNMGVFRRDFFASQDEGKALELGTLLRQAVSRQQIRGEWADCRWINVGTVEDLHRAQGGGKTGEKYHGNLDAT